MTVAQFDRRDLLMLGNLFKMNLSDRFLGSTLGLIWAILNPVLLIGIFCFVFTYVFPGRLPGQTGSLPYIIWLISGYGPWLALNEGLISATSSVVSGAGIVKNIAFKSELLPMVGALMGIVPLVVSMIALMVFTLAGGHLPSPAIAILPFSVILLFTFVSGAGLFLGALNVFLRDISLILSNILTIMLFVSPIFYPVESYPAMVRWLVVFNPFYVLAECFRLPIVNGVLPPLWMIVYMTGLSAGLFFGGLWWFRRLKSFFDTRL